jgi:hypothetical protein
LKQAAGRWLLSFSLVLLSVFLFMLMRFVYASIYGVPPGYTGSPVDGITCATMGCHRGPVTTVPGWITTNIPPNGYMPADTYTVTLSASRPNTSVFGFQITAQTKAGIVGEFLISDPVQTQYSQGTGYVTHKAAGSSGNNQKSWQMKWIAPADTNETGVTFYAAMVVGYFDQDDEVFLSTRTYNSAYLSVQKNPHNNASVTCSPVPFGSHLTVQLPETITGEVSFGFFNTEGVLMKTVIATGNPGERHSFDTELLPKGVTFLVVKTNQGRFTRKLIKI